MLDWRPAKAEKQINQEPEGNDRDHEKKLKIHI